VTQNPPLYLHWASRVVKLLNKQQIPIEAASQNYQSYRISPTNVNQYKDKQIILNSDRLVFNSKKDHILLSSKKTINLNTIS
jgi:hypothetical protein